MKKLYHLDKKAQLGNLAPAILALVFASVLLVFGLVMLQELRQTDVVWNKGLNQNETVYRSANKTIVGLGTFGDFWEIIVLAIVITIVIGLLLVVFSNRGGR